MPPTNVTKISKLKAEISTLAQQLQAKMKTDVNRRIRAILARELAQKEADLASLHNREKPVPKVENVTKITREKNTEM